MSSGGMGKKEKTASISEAGLELVALGFKHTAGAADTSPEKV